MRYLLPSFLLAFTCSSWAQTNFPPPKNTGDPAKLGQNIQRTMTLLATSTPEHRHTARILLYGQSITEQEWAKTVATDLRRRFPNANLLIENRAIGGHSSQLLVKTAEADLYPFYPDLMIFYVYGSHLEYDNIIRRTRERTTAEILLQTDHLTKDTDLAEETNPAKLSPKQWNGWMNYSFLPSTAQKYGCGVVDQRNLWKQYLQDYSLPAGRLLKDGVHLNAHGNYLMAELVKAQLVRRADVPVDPMNCDTIKTVRVGDTLSWKEGKLTLAFDGNRVDAVCQPGTAGTAAPAALRVDGRKPSDIPELYGPTRVSAFPNSSWPCLLRVSAEKPLLLEDWTLTVTSASPDLKTCHFSVSGSKTGPDGEGVSTNRFVSKSGRVVLEPEDWNLGYCYNVFKRTLPANHPVKWKIIPHFTDEFVSPGVKDPTLETTVTLVQGLKNGPHTLELQGTPATPVAALRVYRPPGK